MLGDLLDEVVRRDPVQVGRVAVGSHRLRRRDARRGTREQAVREREHRAGEAIAHRQLGVLGVGGASEVRERLDPGAGRRGAGRLREVAEHGHRVAAGPAGQHAQLHGRQILRLVDDDVVVLPGPALEQRLRLVEQREVGRGPRLGLRPRAGAGAPALARRARRRPRAASAARWVSSDFTSATAPTERQQPSIALREAGSASSSAPSSSLVEAERHASRHRVVHVVDERAPEPFALGSRRERRRARTSSTIACNSAAPIGNRRAPVSTTIPSGGMRTASGQRALDHVAHAHVALHGRDVVGVLGNAPGSGDRAARRPSSASPTSRRATGSTWLM